MTRSLTKALSIAGGILLASSLAACGGGQRPGTPAMGAPGAPPPQSDGSDQALDAIANECARGAMAACDDLYYSADGSNSTAGVFGTDRELDALWNACAAGDPAACDDLYWASPSGSQYEAWARTCGNTTDGNSCG